jgi:hypothetical protein
MMVEKFLFEFDRTQFNTLRDLLGIKEQQFDDPQARDIIVKFEIERRLARGTQGKRGPGRPSLDGNDIKLKRAAYIRKTKEPGKRKDRAAIRRAMDGGHELFDGDEQRLASDVAAGGKMLRKLDRERQLSMAGFFRSYCDLARRRMVGLKQMEREALEQNEKLNAIPLYRLCFGG